MNKKDMIFQERLNRHHDELRWLYMELYGNDAMFAELCDQMYEYYKARKQKLSNSADELLLRYAKLPDHRY